MMVAVKTFDVAAGIPPNVSEFTGSPFFGALFNWFLFGVLMLQTYHYYITFHQTDRIRIQAIVYFTVLLEALQTALLTRDAYLTYVSRWGDPEILLLQGYGYIYIPILGAILSFIVQVFYAWRLHILTKKLWLSGVVIALSTVQMVAGVESGIRSSSLPFAPDIVPHTKIGVTIWWSFSALCDVVIAASMVISLRRSRTGFGKTDTMISKIVQLTLETGLLCAAVAIFSLVFFLVLPTNWNYCIAEVLSKLYTNSLLVVLNSRDILKKTLESSNTQDRVYLSRSMEGPLSPRIPGISVTVEREILKDQQVHIPMHQYGV